MPPTVTKSLSSQTHRASLGPFRTLVTRMPTISSAKLNLIYRVWPLCPSIMSHKGIYGNERVDALANSVFTTIARSLEYHTRTFRYSPKIAKIQIYMLPRPCNNVKSRCTLQEQLLQALILWWISQKGRDHYDLQDSVWPTVCTERILSPFLNVLAAILNKIIHIIFYCPLFIDKSCKLRAYLKKRFPLSLINIHISSTFRLLCVASSAPISNC